MSVQRFLGRGAWALTLILAGGALVVPGPRAGALPPECHPPLQSEDPLPVECEPEPAPPAPPGPIPRNVVVHAANQDAVGAVHSVMNEVLDRVAPANRAQVAGKAVTVDIIPQDWDLTELSRWVDRRGQPIDGDPYGRSYDELRGAARSGGNALDAAVGEEEMVRLQGPGYPSPGEERLGNTLVHELGHTLKAALTPNQRSRLADLHAAARDAYNAGQTQNIIGHDSDPTSFAYTTWNDGEFFAEATAAWFERNGGGRYTRSWVQSHNPALYALLDEIYDTPPPPRFCEGRRATIVRASAGTITGTPGQDVILGSPGGDTIFAGEGSDLVCAGGGADDVHGEFGNDRLRGESGADVLRGSFGNDDLIGGTDDDRLFGSHGDDDLDDDIPGNPTRRDEPGSGNDHMDGGPGHDRVLGGAGTDTLIAGSGNDELHGGPENDHLEARDGNPGDVADGAAGTNTCVIDSGDFAIRCTPSEPPTPPSTTTTTQPPPPTTTTTPPPPPRCPPPSPPSRCHEQ